MKWLISALLWLPGGAFADDGDEGPSTEARTVQEESWLRADTDPPIAIMTREESIILVNQIMTPPPPVQEGIPPTQEDAPSSIGR